MAGQTNPANHFELKGGRIRITYSTGSLAGPAQFHYQDGDTDATFSGDQIKTSNDSALGTTVSVVLAFVPDLRIVTFTLLLPHVNLTAAQTKFSTVGIRMLRHDSFAGPGAVRGQVEEYECYTLSGMAQVVQTFAGDTERPAGA